MEPWGKSHTRSLLEGIERKGRGKLNGLPPLSFFLPSFSALHAGLCHQGQRPKMVEATIGSKWGWRGRRKEGNMQVRFQVFMAMSMIMIILWNVAPCSLRILSSAINSSEVHYNIMPHTAL
jgi:hypothetical protein